MVQWAKPKFEKLSAIRKKKEEANVTRNGLSGIATPP